MSYRVLLLPAAQEAILKQAEYIAADKPLAARQWLELVWDTIEQLSEFPHRGTIADAQSEGVGSEVRRLVVGNYLLFYRVDEAERQVEVLRFRHGARRSPDR